MHEWLEWMEQSSGGVGESCTPTGPLKKPLKKGPMGKKKKKKK
jgi:hypothetical protein